MSKRLRRYGRSRTSGTRKASGGPIRSRALKQEVELKRQRRELAYYRLEKMRHRQDEALAQLNETFALPQQRRYAGTPRVLDPVRAERFNRASRPNAYALVVSRREARRLEDSQKPKRCIERPDPEEAARAEKRRGRGGAAVKPPRKEFIPWC